MARPKLSTARRWRQINGVGFTPAQISGLVLWLDASNGPTLDKAGTQPATTAGDVVCGWRDLSPNGYILTEGVTNAPTLQTQAALNGQRVVRFAGAQRMVGGDILDMLTNNVWLFVVGQITSGTSGTYVGKSIFANAPNRYSLLYDTASLIGLYQDSAVGRNATVARSTRPSTEIVLQRLERSGGTNRLYADGSLIASATAYTDPATSSDSAYVFQMGAYQTAAGAAGLLLPLTGDIKEVVIVMRDKSAALLSASEINQLGRYLANKCARSWTEVAA